MASTRLFLAAALAVAILPTAAAAQQTAPTAPAQNAAPGGYQRHRGGGFRAELRKLNLSAAQQQQIKQILQQARQANQNNGQPVDPQTRRANRQRVLQQIEGVLTPAQRTQFESDMAAQRARHQRGAGNAPAPSVTPAH